MSVDAMKRVCRKVLDAETPTVLVIKGAWGVGKTFAWQQTVKDVKQKNSDIAYSYVSLFGIASLADLKNAILATQLTQSNHPETRVASFVNTVRDLVRGTKAAKYVNIAFDFVALVGPALLRDMVLCLDDFERSEIDANELLGFISELKEGRNCRVVLILNEEKLEPERLNVYRKYREKIIDMECLFAPTAEEALSWGLPQNIPDVGHIRVCAQKLGIRNIRVLQRIWKVYDEVRKELGEIPEVVVYEAIELLVLLTWAYYTKDEDTPSVDFLRTWSRMKNAFDPDGRTSNPQHEAWAVRLQQYGFDHLSALGKAILHVVERGFVDDSGLASAARERAVVANARELEQAAQAAWRLLWDSFSDNADDLKEAMKNTLEACIRAHLPTLPLILNLGEAAFLLRELDAASSAEQLIDLYFQEYSDDPGCDVLDQPLVGQLRDPEVRRRLEDRCLQSRDTPTLLECLKRLANRDGFSVEQEDVLSRANTEQFYQLFKTYNGQDLGALIGACLSSANLRNGAGIREAAVKALTWIREEGPRINEIRVTMFLARFRNQGEPVQRA